MIKIENFDNAITSGLTYGGHSGSKKGIIFNNERWFLKYPKSTRSMNVVGMSYTTSPVSEFIGSQIYRLLDFDTHETKLGIANNKVVVACKDFLNSNETILDYNSLKNDYNENIEREIENLSSSSKHHSGTDIDELLIIMDNNQYFKDIPSLKKHFWDMFIVDAFINNNDRNDNNWGLIVNHNTKTYRVAPIYDNGAAFYSKSSNERIDNILHDEFKMKQVVYDSCVSSFVKNDKVINPLKYIEKMENDECNQALLRVFPKINLEKIKAIFDDIPEEYNGLQILSNEQKDLYYKSLKYKYERVLKPVYDILIKKYSKS